MTEITMATREQLREQRKQKQRQRTLRWFQGLWRSLALIGLAYGAFWVLDRPDWIIKSAAQITIEGNQVLPAERIRPLIPLTYPQPILTLKPQELEQAIEAQGAIAEALVSRRLVPPSLAIQVQERFPVARSQTPISSQGDRPLEPGYLDAEGQWFPAAVYEPLSEYQPLPTLEVTGIRELQLPLWSELYRTLGRSPVEILSINWQDSNNLILNTELGSFHLGPDLTQLEAQLKAIAKLQQTLGTTIPAQDIQYIDLQNPDEPIIQSNKPIVPPASQPETPQPKKMMPL
ncbi:cell division protein FtsQ/DivIB [Picosynechococcus sp. NKBG042902]|uniref:cell division protein FtsQ/DivIB n=1 Tax=Picosynechococcus sp. NKBG042902 TaxID=490193 RepID=UPI0004AA357B|nr:FtsQ-type POTRA domain-containing protein [Picosynechococcus sp. NKBG042902]